MKRSAKNIQMTSYEALFGMDGSGGTEGEAVKEIALAETRNSQQTESGITNSLKQFIC